MTAASSAKESLFSLLPDVLAFEVGPYVRAPELNQLRLVSAATTAFCRRSGPSRAVEMITKRSRDAEGDAPDTIDLDGEKHEKTLLPALRFAGVCDPSFSIDDKPRLGVVIGRLAQWCGAQRKLYTKLVPWCDDAMITDIMAVMKDLRVLGFTFQDTLTDEMVIKLANAYGAKLTFFDLQGAKNITDESVKVIAAKCPNLRVLNVAYTFGKIGDASIKEIAEHCPQLTALELSDTGGNVTDASIVAVAEFCPQLAYLGVCGTKGKITDVGIRAIADKSANLEHLNVRLTKGAVTDAALLEISSKCPKLHSLNICDNETGITDATVIEVATRHPNLRYLHVSNTMLITDAGIKEVALRCKDLAFLNVSYTRGRITDESMAIVARNCTKLDYIDVSFTSGGISQEVMGQIQSKVIFGKTFGTSKPDAPAPTTS